MKPELLSPVGNMEMLYQAIHNGADAVYLSGTLYGARKYAKNFDKEEIKKAIDYAHLYGVKVYITVNTLIYNEEVNDLIKYIEYIHKCGVDAVIMQDIGMIYYVKNIFPNLEIHASTQCHINNEQTVKLLKKFNIKRVVFSRELGIDKISKINDIEKEVFIHGALCVCYSGRCLFSSKNGGRSANRGECAACCRFPYKFVINNKEVDYDNKYLLSMKDLNTSTNIRDILKNNVDCLKIEGRMKSPQYVGYITKIYRKLIDSYYENTNICLTIEEQDNIKQLFNRKFTKGFILDKKNNINSKLQNNEGLYLGEVLSITKTKIKIKLLRNLNLEDGIKFYNQDLGMIVNKIYDTNGLLVNIGAKNDIVFIDNKVGLRKKDSIYKTISKKLNDELLKYDKKKIKVKYKVIARKNGKLQIIISDGINELKNDSKIVEIANNVIITEKDIIDKLSKLGNTPYYVSDYEIDMDDNIFIPISKINEIRRNLIEMLNKKRMKVNEIVKKDFKYYNDEKTDNKFELNIVINNDEAIEDIKDLVTNIYIEDYNLYLKYKYLDNVFYKTSGVEEEYLDLENCKIVASDLGAINKYCKNNYVVGDYLLNVTNNFTALSLIKLGLNKICLSCELDINQISNFDSTLNIEVLIYGKIKLMTTKNCIKKDIIKDCSLCNKNNYYLKHKNNLYLIKSNNCITSIYDYKKLNLIDKIKKLKKDNITKFRLDFVDESKDEIIDIIYKVRKEIENEK